MTNIDQFESIFRKAAKDRFQLEEVRIDDILVVSDEEQKATDEFREEIEQFLRVFGGPIAPTYSQLSSADFHSVQNLLDQVNEQNPDLICTHRNLYTPTNGYPFSLGSYVDVLTQATRIPILLFPRIEELEKSERKFVNTGTQKVMAVTGQLAGDHALVNIAAKFTLPQGELFLSHVEDKATFIRYLDAIDKISDIDSDIARPAIMEQMLSEPRDYIATCNEVLSQGDLDLHVEAIVTFGHHIADYRRLIDEHEIDLLVMHTKDEDQLAMHGLAYPLAVELREIPLLLI